MKEYKSISAFKAALEAKIRADAERHRMAINRRRKLLAIERLLARLQLGGKSPYLLNLDVPVAGRAMA